MPLKLEDLLRRRTPILILTRVDRAVLEEAALCVAPTLNWDDARRNAEVETVYKKWSR
jgi:glycerol-3-phosphate dehydrogenase